MKRNLGFQQKLILVLITAILIVCAGFIFISCGKGPKSKIANPDKGAYALDFTTTKCESSVFCRGLLGVDLVGLSSDKMIANKDLTMEAWVKSKGTVTRVGTSTPAVYNSTFTGGIFGRFDDRGIILYAKNGVLKAAIRRVGATGTATATSDYIVSSGVQILDKAWHHIAAVLTAEDHSAVHADCGNTVSANKTDTVNCPDTGTVCNNDIHLDIYVDGVYRECNTTYGQNNDTSVTQPAYAGEAGEGVGETFVSVGVFSESPLYIPGQFDRRLDGGLDNQRIPAIIDEARLWGVARTQTQINQCKSKELSLDSGTCGRMTTDCINYLRLNEGAGATINDWCGSGTGVLENPRLDWTTGWTTDTPGLDKKD